jgi:hypothetical protein
MILLFILAVGWPLAPLDSTHALGNNWGEYQGYGGAPYLHPGIDVMGITVGKPVSAVQRGIVKAWLTTSADYHWRLAIADSNLVSDSVEAWLYAHIDPYQTHKNVGDVVNPGDQIGYLVEWPVTGFDHCHFARIKDIGAVWSTADWAFAQNPLALITPYADTARPLFEDALAGRKFAFCSNSTGAYLDHNDLAGSVDIVAKISDKTGYPLNLYPIWERLIPFYVDYAIHGPPDLGPIQSFVFKGYLYWLDNVDVLYRNDDSCVTRGDYEARDYFFTVTNTDGDSLIEAGDAAYSWVTTGFPNGYYWVVVTACDAANNLARDSMRVYVHNPGGVDESGTLARDNGLRILPNPFRIRTAIRLQITDNRHRIENLRIYDITGRLRKSFSLTDIGHPSSVIWFGTDQAGRPVPPGVYFAVAEINGVSEHEKIVVVK